MYGAPEGITAHFPVGCRYYTHPWVPPYGSAFGCSNLIQSNLSGSLTLMTKIEWINFEHHALCDGPKGELHGCSE